MKNDAMTSIEIERYLQDKLRGGYYTSPIIAQWLCNWAIRSPNDHVLEPSCGDGIFLEAAAQRMLELGTPKNRILNQLVGVEIISTEAVKAIEKLQSTIGCNDPVAVYTEDFFSWIISHIDEHFDCVVGNPPFIRYQNFPEPSRSYAMSFLKILGFRPNKLTNIWVPFVASSTSCIAPGGRLAMVLPAELLQVSYASQLRSFLVDKFERLDILTCNDLLFERAEQEIVLFLAEGYREKANPQICRINLISVDKIGELSSRLTTLDQDNEEKIVNHESEKWLKYFLTSREISLMRELRYSGTIVSLAHHAKIDVGVVTGRNEFFVLSRDDIDKYSLNKYSVPLVGRSSQLKGAIIDKIEWAKLADDGQKVFLLYIKSNGNASLPDKVMNYILLGEEKNFHTGYKCSIRTPWYKVPSVWIPDGFFFRQIYDFPRVVLNNADAVSTDTIHRMTCNSDKIKLIPCIYTHLTAASAEIEGRSYGGGVLELEPTEAERLLVPKHLGNAMPLEDIDNLIRIGKLDDLLRENDKLVLIDGLGLSKNDCYMLRQIWVKMRDRRIMRSRKKKH
jgi:adenine-specific DNA-methyltransferase